MPVVQYSRQIQQNQPSGFRVQPVATEDTFGASVGKATSQVGQQLSQQAVEDQAKLNQIAVANATSSFQQIVMPIQTDMLSKQGENALGQVAKAGVEGRLPVSEDFAMQTNDAFEKTMKSFDNDVQRQQFGQWYQSIYPSMYNSVLEHEKKQLQIAHDDANKSQLNATAESFQSNVLLGKYKQADMFLRSGMTLSDQMGALNGIPPETIAENQKQYIYNSVGKTVDILLASNRPEDAKKTLDYYGDKLPEGIKDAYMAKINPALSQNEAYNYVESLKNNPALRNPDGTLNLGAMLEAAKQNYMNKTKTVVHPGTGGVLGGGLSWDQTKEVVGGNESNGNYDAYNSDSGAFGKYQFMPGTWSSLMGDAPHTPENQEIAFEKANKEIYDQFGAAGVLVANYAGTSNAERYMKGQDLIGDNGKPYSADQPQYYNGREYPSVRQYVINALGNDGRTATGGTPETTEEVPDPDLVGYKMAEAQIKQAVAEAQAEHKQSLENAMSSWTEWYTTNKPTSISQIEQVARQFGFQGQDLIGAIGAAKQYSGLLKVEQNEQTAATYEECLGRIYNGDITSKEQLDAAYGGSLPYSKLIPLANSFKKEMKWASPENMLAFNGIMKDHAMSGTDQGLVYEKMNQRAAELIKQGLPVTVRDVQELAEDESQKITINKSKFGGLYTGTEDIPKIELPDGWTRTQYGVLDSNGNEVVYDNGQWKVKE